MLHKMHFSSLDPRSLLHYERISFQCSVSQHSAHSSHLRPHLFVRPHRLRLLRQPRLRSTQDQTTQIVKPGILHRSSNQLYRATTRILQPDISGGSRICRRGGRFLEGAYGCAVSRGGGVRRVRPMVATSLSGPVLSCYGPWGWGGGVEDCGTHTHQEN